MLSKQIRRLVGRLSRLSRHVLDRPHDHVARERLHTALQSVLVVLSRRRRPYPAPEVAESLQRLRAHATVVRERLSAARQLPILDEFAAIQVGQGIKDLRAGLHELRALLSLDEPHPTKPACAADRKDDPIAGPPAAARLPKQDA